MLVYDEQLPVLGDDFEGTEVSLLAVRGRRVDGAFRRNYAWAKNALATGKLTKVIVVVALDRDTWVHTVGAVTSALSGSKLVAGARFKVDAEVGEIGSTKMTQVLAALDELKAPEVPTFGGVKPKPKPVEKPVEKVEEKPVDPAPDKG